MRQRERERAEEAMETAICGRVPLSPNHFFTSKSGTLSLYSQFYEVISSFKSNGFYMYFENEENEIILFGRILLHSCNSDYLCIFKTGSLPLMTVCICIFTIARSNSPFANAEFSFFLVPV